ncbi:uncharacterized protein LOC108099244 [Drosophila ficusphila]|uniref:uncharacterized protein LOC108099244 n=1 Tax=Drosophila ficusphila TaxID=30025 RepID=UPI0007E765C0|nr:uncharacterized protein LOC108099244 [Drosophila ficusphila]
MSWAFFVRLLVVISLLKLISGHVEFTNFKCKALDQEFCNFEYCAIKAVNRSYKYLTAKVNLYKVPITRVKVSFGLYKRFNGYKPFLYNFTVDACKFLKNPKSNPVSFYFYEFFKQVSNMNHTCPFDHDIVVDKLTTENMSYRFTKVLSFPEGDYMVETHWIAYDITRAVVTIFLALS